MRHDRPWRVLSLRMDDRYRNCWCWLWWKMRTFSLRPTSLDLDIREIFLDSILYQLEIWPLITKSSVREFGTLPWTSEVKKACLSFSMFKTLDHCFFYFYFLVMLDCKILYTHFKHWIPPDHWVGTCLFDPYPFFHRSLQTEFEGLILHHWRGNFVGGFNVWS